MKRLARPPGLDGLMGCWWKRVLFPFRYPSPSTQELCSPDRRGGKSWQQLWAKPGGRDGANRERASLVSDEGVRVRGAEPGGSLFLERQMRSKGGSYDLFRGGKCSEK